MVNRRQDYRHPFAPLERLHAGFTTSAGQRPGQVVDLSLGGLAAELAADGPPLHPGDIVQVHLTLGPDQPLALRACITHGQDLRIGCRFLSLADATAQSARERRLWNFLLQEQRRRRLVDRAQAG
jgi:hypothetical protein